MIYSFSGAHYQKSRLNRKPLRKRMVTKMITGMTMK